MPDAPPTEATPLPRRRTGRIVIILFLLTLAGFAGCLALVRTQLAAYRVESGSMAPTLKKGDRVLADKSAFRGGTPPRRGDIAVYQAPPEATENAEQVEFIHRVVAIGGDKVQIEEAALLVNGLRLGPEEMNFFGVHDYLRERLSLPDETPVKIEADGVLIGGKERIDAKALAAKIGRPGAKLTLTSGRLLVNGEPQIEPYANEDPGYTFPSEGGALKLEPGQVFLLGDNRNRAKDSHVWGPLRSDLLIGRVEPEHIYPATP